MAGRRPRRLGSWACRTLRWGGGLGRRDTEREIYDIKCLSDEDTGKMKIEISGSSFLKTMVRIMIGSALAIYFEEKDKDYIIRKLENPDADGGKILAPAEGLYLYRVDY